MLLECILKTQDCQVIINGVFSDIECVSADEGLLYDINALMKSRKVEAKQRMTLGLQNSKNPQNLSVFVSLSLSLSFNPKQFLAFKSKSHSCNLNIIVEGRRSNLKHLAYILPGFWLEYENFLIP